MDDVTFLEDDSTWALLTRDHLTSLDKMMKCGQPSKETKEEILWKDSNFLNNVYFYKNQGW